MATNPPAVQNGQSTEIIAADRAKTIGDLVTRSDLKDLVRAALPRGIDFLHWWAALCVEFKRSPKLGNCSIPTVVRSIRSIAHTGLTIGGYLGEAYLVPYGAECQDQYGWAGLVKLAVESGSIDLVQVREVYANEVARGMFKYVDGFNRELTHTPMLGTAAEKGPLVAAYAMALKDGKVIDAELVDQSVIDAVRKKAARGSLMWSDFESMAWRKTAVRRLLRRMPKCIQARNLIAYEDSRESELDAIEPIKQPRALSQATTIETTSSSVDSNREAGGDPGGWEEFSKDVGDAAAANESARVYVVSTKVIAKGVNEDKTKWQSVEIELSTGAKGVTRDPKIQEFANHARAKTAEVNAVIEQVDGVAHVTKLEPMA